MVNKENSLDICFLELLEELCRDSKNKFELTMVNEPSVFELLRFDCILLAHLSTAQGELL